MHMYSNTSNARAAAKKTVEKFPGLGLTVGMPIRAPGQGVALYYPVIVCPDLTLLSTDQRTTLTDLAKVIEAEESSVEVQKPDKTPKRKRVSKAKKAPAKRAAVKSGERVNKTTRAKALMSRKGGVAAEDLIKVFGWEAHTLRGFVSIKNSVKKTDPVWGIKTSHDDKGRLVYSIE